MDFKTIHDGNKITIGTHLVKELKEKDTIVLAVVNFDAKASKVTLWRHLRAEVPL